MSTQTPMKGTQTNLFFGVPATYGGVPGEDDPWIRVPYYSQTLKPDEPLEPDPILGTVRHNNRDARDAAPNLLTHGGDVVMPLDLGLLPFIGYIGFGAPVTTGAGPNLVHTFASGAAELPTGCFELEVGAANFRHLGPAVTRLAFALRREAGFRRVTATFLGQKMTIPGAFARPDDLPDPLTQQVPAAIGTVKWDNVAIGNLIEASGQYDTGAAAKEYVTGAPEISGIELANDATWTGQFRARFSDTALYAAALAGTFGALTLEYQITGDRLLSLHAPRVKLAKTGPEVSGPGGLDASFNFVASQSAVAPMLTMTVKTSAEAWPPAPEEP